MRIQEEDALNLVSYSFDLTHTDRKFEVPIRRAESMISRMPMERALVMRA